MGPVAIGIMAGLAVGIGILLSPRGSTTPPVRAPQSAIQQEADGVYAASPDHCNGTPEDSPKDAAEPLAGLEKDRATADPVKMNKRC